MAKHLVKCYYCHESFDANAEPYVKVANDRRYAHKECYDKAIELQEKEQTDKQKLENYIKQLFGYDKLPLRVTKQIKDFSSDKYGYTYSGILKTLKYFFEIKGNTLEKANGGIGIIPFVYEDARNYYYEIWLAQQENEIRVNTQDAILPTRIIHIKPPERQPMKHIRKLFSFLEEGDNHV